MVPSESGADGVRRTTPKQIRDLTFWLYFYSFPNLGPYTVNGVPLRRVNQKYVIATSTKVEVAGVDVSKVTDATFKRNLSAEKKAATATDLDASVAKATTVSQERLALQKSVDAALEKNVAKVDMLKDYLKARFTLSNNDKPHMMKW